MKIGDSEIKVDVKKIWIRNFKSLKEFTIDLNKINILVGKNGSGKTNVIEALKLFKMILDYFRGVEINPFIEWWGYNNVVWKGNERLPITIGIEYTTEITIREGKTISNAYYEVSFSGIGGSFAILEEKVAIPGMIEYINKPPELKISFNQQFKENLEKRLEVSFSEDAYFDNKVQSMFFLNPYFLDLSYELFKDEWKDKEQGKKELKREILGFFQLFLEKVNGLVLITDSDEWLLKIIVDEFKPGATFFQLDTILDMIEDIVKMDIISVVENFLYTLTTEKVSKKKFPHLLKILEYLKLKEKEKVIVFSEPIMSALLRPLWNLFSLIADAVIGAYLVADKSIIVGKLDYRRVKEPIKLKRENIISDDGSNLTSALYTLGKGRIPERVDLAIKHAFGENCTLQIEPTPDGRAYIKVLEKGIELNPPSIPDGLFKLIALELALEYEAPIIAVDEFENSLYADVIQYFLDELRNSSSKAILTTHSPAVMDFADPEDVIILKKDENGETKPFRFENPQKIRAMLKKEGITFSEYIIYHEISKDEEV